MRYPFRVISIAACGAALCVGCTMLPSNNTPQDPFVMTDPGLAPQRRARPEYPPAIELMPATPGQPAPRSYTQPYSSPPRQTQPMKPRTSNDPYYSQPPRVAPRREAPPASPRREIPRTFAEPDTDRAPEPVVIPPREENVPQRTEKVPTLELPGDEAPSLDGPQLIPLDETASSATTKTTADSTADGRLELSVEVPSRRPVGSGAQYQLSIRNVSAQTLRNVSVRCEFDDALSFPELDRKSVTHKIPRIDAGDVKESSLTLVSKTAGVHECRFSVVVGSQVVLRKSVQVEFVSRQLDWQLHGPTERTVGSRAEFNIPLINVSDKELRDLKIRVTLDAALTVREMTQGGRLGDRTVTWDIDRLAANEGLLLQLEVECREPTTQACLQVAVSGLELPEDETEVCLVVKQRTGSLDVRLHDVTDPISVGDDAELVVTIQNEGLQFVKEIVTTCNWPEGLEFVSATIVQGGRSEPVHAEIDGRTATLTSLEKLAPNQSVEYHVLLKGRFPGTHRVSATVNNNTDSAPAKVTEPVMVHR